MKEPINLPDFIQTEEGSYLKLKDLPPLRIEKNGGLNTGKYFVFAGNVLIRTFRYKNRHSARMLTAARKFVAELEECKNGEVTAHVRPQRR